MRRTSKLSASGNKKVGFYEGADKPDRERDKFMKRSQAAIYNVIIRRKDSNKIKRF